MTPLEQLTKRVEDVERQYLILTQHRNEMDHENAKVSLTDHAFRLAIRSLGAEIAEHHGISSELYLKRFQSLCRWHLDELLRTSSDAMPGYVSALDARTVEQIPTDDIAPRILAPPDEEET